jgi:glycosyltransferase involved in cell wall biosynthesis
MKFIYLTSQKYPSKKVDPFFVKSMAESFSKILRGDFTFVVRGDVPKELEAINTVAVKAPRRFRVVSYFFYMPFLIFLHKWDHSDFIFFSSDPYLLAIIIFWRKMFGFRYSVCSDWHQLFDDWRDHYVARNSDYMISTSKRLRDSLASIPGVTSEKVVVSYGGVDTSIFEEKIKTRDKIGLRKGLALPEDAFLVGYVGGFRSVGLEKGIDIMIKSLPFLGDNISMVFVGGSKQEINNYRLLAEEEGVQDRCIFIEKQPFGKVVEYEISMDILVIPYPNKKHFRDYGFPMKVWEYMASGRPIVYSDLSIIREVLGGRGKSFVPDSPASLAESIVSIFENYNLAENTAKQNLCDTMDYTWEARSKNIVNFIKQKIKNE